MRILVAEDDAGARRLLENTLVKRGYDVLLASNGREALEALERESGPILALLDWMMPEIDGVDVCRQVHDAKRSAPIYMILLTAKGRKEDVIEGLGAGADDYVTKPFNVAELCARINVGMRMLALQTELADRVRELEDALSRVKQLQGLLPICSYCKNIRDDQNYWHQVDEYISVHSDAQFTHGICPVCYDKIIDPLLRERRERLGQGRIEPEPAIEVGRADADE